MAATKTLWERLIEVQKEMGAVKKDSKNPHFKSSYASYPAVIDYVKPLLNKHGLLLEHTSQYRDNLYLVGSRILCPETAERTDTFEIPFSLGKAQEMGSYTTYGKRYSTEALLALPTEDDDGNLASGRDKEDGSQVYQEYEALDDQKVKLLKIVTAHFPALSTNRKVLMELSDFLLGTPMAGLESGVKKYLTNKSQ